jgi:hypothetical protein
MKPTIGRIVHYKLRPEDVRSAQLKSPTNPHSEGQVLPMIVCCVWPNEFGEGTFGINGQVFLDGEHSLWITSAGEGVGIGQWSWPEKV